MERGGSLLRCRSGIGRGALWFALVLLLGAAGCARKEDLFEAIRDGDRERVARLVGRRIDVESQDEHGLTPLLQAILQRRTEIALLLIDRVGDLDRAVSVDARALAEILPVEDRSQVQMTPLVLAVLVGNRRVTRALLDRGAHINAAAEQGFTALHAAALTDRRSIARLLIDRGATIDALTADAQTPLDLARAADSESIIAILDKAKQGELNQAIDVAGHYTLAADTSAEALDPIWQWGAVPVGVAITGAGAVLWSEYRNGTIRQVDSDGREITSVASELDGPLGIAVDDVRGLVFYTRDRHYPRAIDKLRPGTPPVSLISATRVNRPFALAVVPAAERIYWSETINGKVRRSDYDGDQLVTLFEDGISSFRESSTVNAAAILGVAIDSEHDWVFWSDVLSATISRSHLDGSERETILTAAHGLDMPTGIAYDPVDDKIYWVDPGVESLARANSDGSQVEVLLSGNNELMEPYGIAIDVARRRLYWTDIARNALGRLRLDSRQAERFLDLSRSDQPVGAAGDRCAVASFPAEQELLRRTVKAVRTCLVKVAAAKAVKRRAADANIAASTCARQLDLSSALSRLDRALRSSCSEVQRADAGQHVRRVASEVVRRDFPRAGEWLREVRPFVEETEPPLGTLSLIDDLSRRLEAADSELAPTPSGLPVSGQRTTYAAITGTRGSAGAVPDDGRTRQGSPLIFQDNQDGTITDKTSGLMWEKKCDDCGDLHGVESAYAWHAPDEQMDAQGWLAAINSEDEQGFAGYHDWRFPTIAELVGIVDYELFNPAIGRAFDGSRCGLGCDSLSSPECSCTRLGIYWSSSTLASSGSHLVLNANLGLVAEAPPDWHGYLRAVRGSSPTEADIFIDNADGTITDRRTGLMWEKKCDCEAQLHHFDLHVYWSFDGQSPTIWDWIASVNSEGGSGFAGHSDWRVPNIKELFSLVDYTAREPAIAAAFRREHCADIQSPKCSVSESGMHWSSTTFADFPAHALGVGFNLGNIDDRVKTLPMAVRAVRGPVSASLGTPAPMR